MTELLKQENKPPSLEVEQPLMESVQAALDHAQLEIRALYTKLGYTNSSTLMFIDRTLDRVIKFQRK